MTTAYKQIADDFAAALWAATAISNQVYQARLDPIANQFNDAIVVRLGATQVEQKTLTYGRMLCQTEVAVECYAKSPTGNPTAAVDTLLQNAYARLAGDATVNAAARDLLMAGITWDYAQEADQMACATMTWQVTHQVESSVIT